MKKYKIAVAGTGYVGLSIATLLSQHHHTEYMHRNDFREYSLNHCRLNNNVSVLKETDAVKELKKFYFGKFGVIKAIIVVCFALILISNVPIRDMLFNFNVTSEDVSNITYLHV